MDLKAAFAPMLKKQEPKVKKRYRFNHDTQEWVEVKPPQQEVKPPKQEVKLEVKPEVTPTVIKRLMRIEELVVGQPCKKCGGHGLLPNYGNKICFVCSANKIIRDCDVANFKRRTSRGQPTYIYETA